MTFVVLNEAEWDFATKVGVGRQQRRDSAGHFNAHDSRGGVWEHIWGCRGELAYAKASGQYPSGLFADMSDDDDVSGTQVRTRTGPKCDPYLWLNDDPDDVFAFAINMHKRRFKILGPVRAGDFMVAQFFTKAHPVFPREDCYVIPQDALRPLGAAA